jgi:uncharacterized membrane protein
MGHAGVVSTHREVGEPSSAARGGPAGLHGWTSVSPVVRLVAMLVLAVTLALVIGFAGHWYLAPVAGWDAAALLFVTSVWVGIGPMGPQSTEVHATRENPGRAASELIILCSAVASLIGVGVLLVRANSAHGAQQSVLAALGVGSVALSWFAVHTLFTLRYAMLYYSGPEHGVDFKSKVPPRYTDFAYLAFTIGMTFQVSDTDLRSSVIRVNVLRHALLSFLFVAVILAATINLVAGLGSGSG